MAKKAKRGFKRRGGGGGGGRGFGRGISSALSGGIGTGAMVRVASRLGRQAAGPVGGIAAAYFIAGGNQVAEYAIGQELADLLLNGGLGNLGGMLGGNGGAPAGAMTLGVQA